VHPCYPADYEQSIKLCSVFDTPCNKRQTPCISDDNLQIKGTGNYNQCMGNVSHLFSLNHCSYSKCSFDGVFQPNITGNFMVRVSRVDNLNLNYLNILFKYIFSTGII